MDRTNVPLGGLRALLAPLCLAFALQAAHAGPTDLADIPMANSSTVNILPNIMLDLDNSGSMSWDYMPDHVRYQSNGSGFALSCRGPSGLVTCELGDAPRSASSFNGLYYNPAIRYLWPLNAAGGRLADKQGNTAYVSPWSAVPSDGYGKQMIEDTSAQPPAANSCLPAVIGGTCPRLAADATIDLVKGYPERVWCSHSSDKPPSANCKSALDTSNNYAYPDSTYKYLKVLYAAPFYYNVSVEWCTQQDSSGFGRQGTCQAKKTTDYKYVRYSNWSRVSITPATVFPAKAAARTDCAGATCTYDEEMANFATWYAWYRTRAQMTKSAIGLSFGDVRGTPIDGDLDDANFLHARVGLTTINNPIALNIANFDNTLTNPQRGSFYSSLYDFIPYGGTPLRASLKSVGDMYAGTSKIYTDPLQYSCQKNYAILATDGYWNDTLAPKGEFTPPDAANPDQDKNATRPSKDDLKTSNTLADVAYYYYHTDLRTSCPKNDVCTNNVSPSGSDADVDDVAQHQHMTTFTIGLGVDGTLTYDPNYKTSTSGDYYNIKQGTTGYRWPAPAANQPETIDDLWHAAVNGRGTYFSASNPAVLQASLKKALSSIDVTSGSGAAAATSNLQPTAGDNFIYQATYRTLKWDSDISAFTIDLSNGTISANPVWQAEPLLRGMIAAAGNSDTRTIYTGNYGVSGTIARTLFTSGSGGLTSAQLALFDTSKLSQADGWTAAQAKAATPASLVNYLRGQDRNEDQSRPATYGTYDRLYRDREKILGDIVHAQPVYVKQSNNTFTDAGFGDFKASTATRAATLYAASNDGMLHAFDAQTGQERWAFIPPMLLPNLWRLADVNYESKHRYYLDGPMTINDANVSGAWKTVLIGSMGKGGRGYYALDVTNPADPKIMWEFNADKNPNLGYTYGAPVITKRKDGKWVAVLASGYNNIPESDGSGGTRYAKADGGGYVFVLDIGSGQLLTTIATGVGSVDNPSGLAWLNVRVDKFETENLAEVAYGGDLTGTLWRFDLDNGTASHLADLGSGQPIMAAPEVGEIDFSPIDKVKTVYFGTGRYLGKGDLDDVGQQTLYGIKDTGSNTVSGKTGLKAASASGSGTTRNVTGADVNWGADAGWYLDLIDQGERLTLNPQLYFGTVVFATTVPSISECQPGGFSWLYQLDFQTGGKVNDNAGAMKYTSPVVGVTVSKLPNGTPIIHAVTADGKKPNPTELQVSKSPPVPKRVLWREVTN